MRIQVFPFKLESNKYPASDVEKEHFEADTSLVLGRTHVSSVPSDIIPTARAFKGLENGKRPSSNFCSEAVNKRAKQEFQVISITSEEKYSSEEPAWKIPAAIDEYTILRSGLDQLEDLRSPLSEHSHRRPVPIGSDHQADLPTWTPRNFRSSCLQFGFCDTYSAPSFSASSPQMDGRRLLSECDCTDEGSVVCVRQHVMAAREKLRSALGEEKFVELGFLDMGEDVAERWTEMEQNLFHMVVSSNPTSSGRNFWTVLPHAFPLRAFRELVSYYFNVFILRKRADQNHFYPSNVDSDDDDWQENCDGDFVSEEEDEEVDSGVESPADDENNHTIEDDASEELDFEDEVDDEEEDEGFYCCKSIPCREQIERNSTDCSPDQDVQDDSCTSFERLCNAERDQENNCMEHRNYEFLDGNCDSKPWEINYIGGAQKNFDFFPTCNVLEEVFGKGSWDKDKKDGRESM